MNPRRGMNPGAPRNPFATVHLALPFQEPSGEAPGAPARLLDEALARREGEVIGPQGTGKTTLLRALLAEASARGLRVALARVPQGGWRPPSFVWNFCRQSRPHPALLLLDSAEQLALPVRWLLRAWCRATGVTLLVTAHRPLGLPALRRTSVTEAMAERLAAAVLARSPDTPPLVTPSEAREALRQSGGNAREALFALYDRYEQRWGESRRPHPPAPSPASWRGGGEEAKAPDLLWVCPSAASPLLVLLPLATKLESP